MASWAGLAAFLVVLQNQYFHYHFWPLLAVFALGSWARRLHLERRRAILIIANQAISLFFSPPKSIVYFGHLLFLRLLPKQAQPAAPPHP